MSPQAAAVFAQVIPMLYIAVFLGSKGIWQIVRIGKVVKFLVLTPLLVSPVAEMTVLSYVLNGSDSGVFSAWFIYLTTYSLAFAMFIVAWEGAKAPRASEDETGENESGNNG